jgi:hypothetical protein
VLIKKFYVFLDQKKPAKIQWVQDPSQSNVDYLNNVRREACRRFRIKETEYRIAKIDGLETNSKIKNIRDLYMDISDFKKDCQPRTKILMNEKGALVTNFHSILAMWRNHFSHLFNVQGISEVRQTETHTTEPLLPERSDFEFEIAFEKLTGTIRQVEIKSQQN